MRHHRLSLIPLTLVVLLVGLVHSAAAAPITTLVPFEFGTRSLWAQTIEAESAAVAKYGTYSIFNVGPQLWNSGVWLFSVGSEVQAVFSVPADTLIVQFEADANDGVAAFFVDNEFVNVVDTYNLGWFGVQISGLPRVPHTLAVTVTGPPRPGLDDLAIDVLGAVASPVPPVPEPSTLLLVGMGLGVVAARRRLKTRA